MPSATTLKLPPALKARIAATARDQDKSPHAFMIEALTMQIERAESRRLLIESAIAAENDVATHGLVYDATDVFAWMRNKLAGQPTPRPRARKTGKRA